MDIKVVINKALAAVQVLIESPTRELAIGVTQLLSDKKEILKLKTTDGIQLIQINEIEAVEVFGDEVVLTLIRGETIKIKGRLYKIKDQLDDQQFVQMTKSSIVNLRQVEKLENSFSGNMLAQLKSGRQQAVSRRYLVAVKKVLGV